MKLMDNFLDLSVPIGDKLYPAWLVEGVDGLLEKIDHQSIWTTCDFIIEIWAKRNPDAARQFYTDQEVHRASRLKATGANKSNSMRSLAHIPPLIKYLLDKLLTYQINAMGEQEFYRQFVKRYPGFSSVERV